MLKLTISCNLYFIIGGPSTCQEPNWRIGAGGITKGQVLLIGAVHVTQGSWQHILQLNRYLFSRYQRLQVLP